MGAPDPLETYRRELAAKRFTVLPADVIISAQQRLAIRASVFGDDCLEPDLSELHPDRSRADAVLRFRWSGDDIDLSLGPNAARDPENRQVVSYTANYARAREYRRLRALEVTELKHLIAQICRLLPSDKRLASGLLGVHALRTFGKVVLGRHRDGSSDEPVDWVVSFVVSKAGSGAESQLTLDKAGQVLIARAALNEGQLMVHQDSMFFHYVTPLEPQPGARALREAIVVAVLPES